MDDRLRKIQRKFRSGEASYQKAYLRELQRSGVLGECLDTVCETAALSEDEDANRAMLAQVADCVAPMMVYIVGAYNDEMELYTIGVFVQRAAALEHIAETMIERGDYFLDGESYEELLHLYRGEQYEQMFEQGPIYGLDYVIDERPLWGTHVKSH